ncbi:gamma-glutamyl hydrolase-like isoform X2 [Bradysia coprophila]|uniref:gamma-glutamyl hydrolase-like isoform X2 n=1 Tax=Bradysia coprophila TaxID=38358 RepID=UPI00187D8676|nr:gamma-glutamyl hydrolase-like isoform X2 [Bradysia coprophila]
MPNIIAILVCVVVVTSFVQCQFLIKADVTEENDSPIIGVLTQEISYHLNSKWPGEFKSYIAASYVKFVEGGGARVVPIWIDRPKSYYEGIMSKINGVLFPGGATWFNQTNGYSEAGRHIYDIAMDMNDRGEYMPIFGTCLGFELLTYLSANSSELRENCYSDRQALHLEFEEDFRNSKLFGSCPDDIVQILSSEPVTANFHQFCVTKKNLTLFGIDEEWKVLSENNDFNGQRFISSYEHVRYPFYGIQFHPEKNIYEWIINRNISHTPNAIKAAQYFAYFFVDEARKNFNSFDSVDEENSMLIYNYQTNFTALVKSAFEQCYLFDSETDYIPIGTINKNKRNGKRKIIS